MQKLLTSNKYLFFLFCQERSATILFCTPCNARISVHPAIHIFLDTLQCTYFWTPCNVLISVHPAMHVFLDTLQCTYFCTPCNARISGHPAMHLFLYTLQCTYFWTPCNARISGHRLHSILKKGRKTRKNRKK